MAGPCSSSPCASECVWDYILLLLRTLLNEFLNTWRRGESLFFRFAIFLWCVNFYSNLYKSPKTKLCTNWYNINWLIWIRMALICINSYHKKEIDFFYPMNCYNIKWLIWICMKLIHINSCFYSTNWYNINWLIWICMILIHISLCFYPTNRYNTNRLI